MFDSFFKTLKLYTKCPQLGVFHIHEKQFTPQFNVGKVFFTFFPNCSTEGLSRNNYILQLNPPKTFSDEVWLFLYPEFPIRKQGTLGGSFLPKANSQKMRKK
tara:strand:- start:777 stop:1082 length:306 start_codon:yes stop_codon:yes gene_type:complete